MQYTLAEANREPEERAAQITDLRAQVAQLTLERDGCRDLIATLRSRVAERECDLTRIAEAQRPHCTTECIEGVWWAKGKSGGVYGPHSTEREALLEVAEMAALLTEASDGK